jgi:hypothetical protein
LRHRENFAGTFASLTIKHPKFIGPLYHVSRAKQAQGSEDHHMQKRERRASVRRGLLAATALGLGLLVLIVGSYVFGWQWTGFPEKSLFDWLQILVFPAVVAVGVFVLNQTVKERERETEKAQRQNEYRRDLLTRLTRAYNDTKKVRRLLRANLVTDRESNAKEIACTVYEEHLQELMDPQLEFEFLEEELRFLKDQPEFVDVSTRIEAIEQRVRQMRPYLKEVIDEYEDENSAYKEAKSQVIANGACRVRLDNLPMLKDFIYPGPVRYEFRVAFYSAIREIQEGLWAEQMT